MLKSRPPRQSQRGAFFVPLRHHEAANDLAYRADETVDGEAQLKDAPAFSDDSWGDREWETRTHQHYGAATYWGA